VGGTVDGMSESTAENQIPRWLRFVLISDRAGSAWYIGTGFFFAPVLAVLSPWPTVTAVCWAVIGLAGLWLGLLGIAMATGLALVLRSNAEIPEGYWRSIIDYPEVPAGRPQTMAVVPARRRRRSPPASA
jgi:spore maturation protein SpmA